MAAERMVAMGLAISFPAISGAEPWLFGRINHYLDTGEVFPGPSMAEIKAMILRHGRMLVRFKGEGVAMREMRGHMAWYTKGMPHSATLRNEINQVETLEGFVELLDRKIQSLQWTHFPI